MIQIKNLNCKSPKLSDINLDIKGHTVIIGPSGAGKTTFLRCIAGLQPYTGDIILNDQDAPALAQQVEKLHNFYLSLCISG